ncbi:MAG TPA: PepSY domain-containing protein [Candidatus Acidoferrum sp.]|nr:PepSY domain-containing protein [Candidatus Acidoferrum sp.]
MLRSHRFARVVLSLIMSSAAIAAAMSAAADEEGEYDERHDHDAARQAVARGEALPLDAVLAAVERKVVGEVVGIEFEKSDGVWVYEFRVVDSAGHVIEVLADAKTAAIIRVEGE